MSTGVVKIHILIAKATLSEDLPPWGPIFLYLCMINSCCGTSEHDVGIRK